MLILLALGVVSGLASFYAVYASPTIEVINYAPGIFFGLALMTYFTLFRKARIPLFGPVFFILIATASYYAAVFTTLTFWPGVWSKVVGDPLVLPFSLMSAGCLGSFFTLLGFHFLLAPLNRNKLLFGTLAGTLLGLSWYIIPPGTFFASEGSSGGPSKENFLSLYLFWQTGMAWVLSLLLKKDFSFQKLSKLFKAT